MTANELNTIRKEVSEFHPLIHCITNPISINQCANTILAAGARPIMAEHPDEVCEITTTAQALVLNLGNITDARLKSISLAAKTARERNIPFVLDLVGIACSTLRRTFAQKLLEKNCPSIIKGNYSEILSLHSASYRASGVDAEGALDEDFIIRTAALLARKYDTIVLASGKIDIVTDGNRLIRIRNGTPALAGVTGTGCMLGALCGCYLSVSRNLTAAVAACVAIGICGELSRSVYGIASFAISLIDNLSLLSDKDIEENIKVEETEIENI